MAASGARQVGVGIIGAGKMGKIHAANIRAVPSAKLVAVADVVEDSAKRLASEHGATNVFTDYLRLIDNRDVQAVVIAAPTQLKPQIVKFACEAGKHVLCEEPVAPTFHEADQVAKSAQKTAAKFQVGYQRRFDPFFSRVKDRIDSGDVGSVVLVRSNTRDPIPNQAQLRDVKSTGGIFFETCGHDYDLVRWLCGSEVSRVEADGSPRSTPDQHTVVTNLSLANGVVAQVDASRMSAYGYDVRVEVMGSKGLILTTPDSPTGMRVVKGAGQEAFTPYPWYPERFKDAYRLEMEGFIDSIIKDTEPRVSAQDGKAAVEIAAAARKSMQEGKAVNLPL